MQPGKQSSWFERLGWRLWAWSMAGPRRYRLATAIARIGQKLPFVARIAPPLAAWRSSRELPKAAPRPFRSTFRSEP